MENWEEDLNDIFKQKERKETKQHDYEEKIKDKKDEVNQFYHSVVLPAFNEIKLELEKYDREIMIDYQENMAYASIVVVFKEFEEYKYNMLVKTFPDAAIIDTEHICLKNNRPPRAGWLHTGVDYGGTKISTVCKEEIIRDFLRGYRHCMLYQ